MNRYILIIIGLLTILGIPGLLKSNFENRDLTNTPLYARDSYTVNFSEEVFPWLQENGLTTMKNVSEFRPGDTITRSEAAKFITHYAAMLGLDQPGGECHFSDTMKYEKDLRNFMRESCKYGLLRGSAGRFLPTNTVTEAQALAVIGRSLYGMQDEKRSPWYSEYYTIGKEIGLITDESGERVSMTNITREKLGTWLYIAAHTEDKGENPEDDTIVYETDVDGPDDCSSFEKYDSSRKVCSFECTSERECKSIQSQIEHELDSWSSDLGGADRNAPSVESEATSTNTKVAYSVTSGEKIQRISGTDTLEYQALWKEVADLSPDGLSDTYIEKFEIYADPKSDVIAFVSDDDGNGKWTMAINLPTHKLSDTKEQKATLIHELSHIITLNKEQFMSPNGKCPNYETDEGCTKSTAYLNAFVQKYWGNTQTARYDAKKFVSEYAASSPEEDIAESFAFYVLSSDFSDTPIREQKMNFFNAYPELVKIRSDMRKVLASGVVRAKKGQKTP